MASREAYQKKLEAQLHEWDARLDILAARARKSAADAQIAYENELAELKTRRSEALRTLEQIRKSSEDAWEDTKVAAEKVWSDMGKAMERAAAHFK